jgi:hypothetical protein
MPLCKRGAASRNAGRIAPGDRADLAYRVGQLPVMATHDAALGVAARAFGFDVRGIG